MNDNGLFAAIQSNMNDFAALGVCCSFYATLPDGVLVTLTASASDLLLPEDSAVTSADRMEA